MDDLKKSKLAILAYGSLIEFPGDEISSIENKRIPCKTPFKVEFGRKSRTRGNAPTLIPVIEGGKNVNAVLIVLNEDTDINDAKSILWRRELHKTNFDEQYLEPKNVTPNRVVIKTIENFMDVEKVLYTSIGSNIDETITPNLLAEFAINSILTKAGEEHKDGLRYLLSAKNNNIITEFSEEYEKQILSKTKTKSLEEAILLLDGKRNQIV